MRLRSSSDSDSEPRPGQHGDAAEVASVGTQSRVFVTCEHASERMPDGYALDRGDARLAGTHWAFDLGARELAHEYAALTGGAVVSARFSRLVVDPNRPETSETLFRTHADGLPIALNRDLDRAARSARLDRFYRPFHAAVDRALDASPACFVLAMHTFTPLYEGVPRALEIGVLFDREEALACRLVDAFVRAGFHAAPNEPYSGRDGLMHVADTHATAHGRRAIELEVRQDLAVRPDVRARVLTVLADILEG